MNVLFVCLENVCRSPIAQAVAQGWRGSIAAPASTHRFESAGLRAGMPNAPMDLRAVAALERRGYRADTHRARAFEVRDFDRYDLIVAMDNACLHALRRSAPVAHAGKLSLLLDWVPDRRGEDVPDPYFGAADGFDAVVTLCALGVAGLFASVLLPSPGAGTTHLGGNTGGDSSGSP
jgi:protein-tyrosine phosphatase